MKPALVVRYFEDFHEGDRFRTQARTVTEGDIEDFARVSGDFNRIHLDEEYSKHTIYGSRIAHGMLTLAMTSGLTYSLGLFEGSLVAIYGIENVRFIKPVRIGDSIAVNLEVTGRREKGEAGVVTVSNEVVNQRGETVLAFDKLLLLKKGKRANMTYSASASSKKDESAKGKRSRLEVR